MHVSRPTTERDVWAAHTPIGCCSVPAPANDECRARGLRLHASTRGAGTIAYPLHRRHHESQLMMSVSASS
eukprot:1905539-Prymnesium_polylepis.2